MMGVDEQRRARAMPAEHFEQSAICGLAQSESAAAFRQASPQNSQSTESIDDLLRNHRLAVDGDRIDLLAAELPQFLDPLRRPRHRARNRETASSLRFKNRPKKSPLANPTSARRSPSSSSASAICFSRFVAAIGSQLYPFSQNQAETGLGCHLAEVVIMPPDFSIAGIPSQGGVNGFADRCVARLARGSICFAAC